MSGSLLLQGLALGILTGGLYALLASGLSLYFAAGVAIQRLLIARLAAETMAMMSVLLTFAIALLIEGTLGAVYTGSYRSINPDYANASFNLFGTQLPYDRMI